MSQIYKETLLLMHEYKRMYGFDPKFLYIGGTQYIKIQKEALLCFTIQEIIEAEEKYCGMKIMRVLDDDHLNVA